jgi:sodium transport system permease protein
MNWRTVGTVLAKELKETVRDRRTILIMIVIPAFLYPGIFILMEQMALFGQRRLEGDPVRVAVVGSAANALLRGDPAMRVVEVDDPMPRLRDGTLDAVVDVRPRAGEALDSRDAQILFDGSRDRSQLARGMVDRRLREQADSLLARRLEAEGLPRSFAEPLAVRDSSVATAEQLGGYALGRFLPMILILMTVLGAFYPAIDLAAGEKERGTLEPLLATPVPEDEIVAGKFAAVTIIALTAATLNLLSMLLTFQAGLFQFTQALDIEFRLSAGAMLLTMGALALLALFFASLFLGVAVRSHSFREAQNALTPIYIVSFLPALLAAMPGIAFTEGLAAVPIAGVALLFRALLTGSAEFAPTLIAIGSTVVYAMIALVFAVRAFGREDILFGSGATEVATGTWGERLRRWRETGDGIPRAGTALLFVAGVALLAFYFGARFQVAWGERGILAMQWLLLGLPALLFAAFGPFDLRRTLALRGAPPRAFGAALLIVAGGLPIGWALGWVQTFVLELPQEFMEALQGLLTANDPARLLWLLFLVAVTPAVCEELVFRGVLLQSASREMRMGRAVVLSAVVFGAFHLSTATAIRFLPTMWIGLLLGYVVWHTRSVYTSMLMHFANNATAVLLVSSPTLAAYVMGAGEQPNWWLVAVAPLVLATGVWLLPKRPAEAAPPSVRSARQPVAAS